MGLYGKEVSVRRLGGVVMFIRKGGGDLWTDVMA